MIDILFIPKYNNIDSVNYLCRHKTQIYKHINTNIK